MKKLSGSLVLGIFVLAVVAAPGDARADGPPVAAPVSAPESDGHFAESLRALAGELERLKQLHVAELERGTPAEGVSDTYLLDEMERLELELRQLKRRYIVGKGGSVDYMEHGPQFASARKKRRLPFPGASAGEMEGTEEEPAWWGAVGDIIPLGDWGAPKISGSLFLDDFGVSQDKATKEHYGNVKNKAGIRDMRLAVSGTGYGGAFDYKLEASWSPNSGRVNIADAWLGINNIPFVDRLQAGHFKPETGLIHSTDALYTSLSEFTGPASSFGLGRRFGAAGRTHFLDKRLRLFYGAFQEGATATDRYIQEDNQGQVYNMRLSGTPILADGGRHVLHLGAHASYVSPRNRATSMSTTFGSIGWLPNSVTTGVFANKSHIRAGLELAYQYKGFSARAEGFMAKYDGYRGTESNTAWGGYVELGFFLTGDHRVYNLDSGAFEAVDVKSNFLTLEDEDGRGRFGGLGAWQVVAQLSHLDLTDWRSSVDIFDQNNNVVGANRLGGYQRDITLGLNWFLTPKIRAYFEYVHSQQNIGADKKEAKQNIFGTGLRVHF